MFSPILANHAGNVDGGSQAEVHIDQREGKNFGNT
jgi:hypothetical protein